MQGQIEEGIDDGPLDWIKAAGNVAMPPHLQASIASGVVKAVAKVRRAIMALLLEEEIEGDGSKEQATAGPCLPGDRQMAGSLLKQLAMGGLDDEVSLGE